MSFFTSPTAAKRLYLVSGSTSVFRLAITNPDCTPADLSNYDITFTIKRSKYDLDQSAVWQGTLADGIEIVDGDPTAGVIDVTVPNDATINMRGGLPYFWDVKLIAVDTSTYVPIMGTIYAALEVTQSA
jgi:hypothetical protein